MTIGPDRTSSDGTGPRFTVLLDDRGPARPVLQPWLRGRPVDVVWIISEAIDAPPPDEVFGAVPVVALSPVDVAALQSEPAAHGVDMALVVFTSVDLLAQAFGFGFDVERVHVSHYAPEHPGGCVEWATDITFTAEEARTIATWLDAGHEFVAQRLPLVTPRPLSPPGD